MKFDEDSDEILKNEVLLKIEEELRSDTPKTTFFRKSRFRKYL